ncbi:RNA polymerase sigma factor [Roseobacter cerasinus]|uniref:RNA polymerase sigma factor n=1 Tax=Roseobacter cerasinus TaxID=2602289 RepID=UPI001EEAE1BA|nr:RNA polymerase sigma factor [Roseobacter cerasinus]
MKLWPHADPRAEISAGLPAVFPRIWRYALTLTGARDRADDLAQTVCLRAMEKAEQFEPGSKLDRWLFRITHNIWVNELRKEAVRRGGGLVAVEEAEIADPRQNPEQDQIGRELRQSVLRLPETQRQTVMLVYIEGYSYRDAAEILDIPIGTVMSRLATARATLGVRFRDQEVPKHAR